MARAGAGASASGGWGPIGVGMPVDGVRPRLDRREAFERGALPGTDIDVLRSSLDDLRGFPRSVPSRLGLQLDRVQRGLEPEDWKVMQSVGPGVRELRVREASGAYRVIYVATWGTRVHVLHAFQKKTEATEQRVVDLARRRFAAVRSGGG